MLVAVAATLALVQLRGLLTGRDPSESTPAAIARGQPAPAIIGMTLDGGPFDLASLRGRPVIVNFWGPSCIPCRDEFPLFKEKLAAHAGTGLVIVGILMDDPAAPARDFIAQYGATSVLLFGIDEKGTLRVATSRIDLQPKPGWTVLVLVPPKVDAAEVEKAGTATAEAAGSLQPDAGQAPPSASTAA